MRSSFAVSRSFYSLMTMPLLAASLLAGAAAAHNAKSPDISATSVRANDGIISLPLQPIVPASHRLCAARTPTGLGYTILRVGSGPKPAAPDTVLVNYIGYLAATGTVFDQAMQTAMALDQVIPGFSEGLRMTGKAGIVRICIPSALGYGAQATGTIPANADLVFQVELLDFKTPSEMEAFRNAQAAEPPNQTGAASQP